MGSIWGLGKGLMQSILDFFQGITGSYGWAIILLTIAVRLLLYPLSHKQMASMASMQKIQPRLKIIQEKYAGDKQKLNEEMMRLYRENNVNPMAGCLPLLIQIPIMIMLFRVLMDYQVTNSSFIGISLEHSLLSGMGQALSITPVDGTQIGVMAVINAIIANPAGLANVGLYLPTLLFTIFICFLTWFQQKLSGAASNPQMASMNVIMPVFMGFICLSLPGGVLIYWGTSSLIGILQQWIVMRRAKEEAAVKPALYKNKPTSGQEKPVSYPNRSASGKDAEEDDEYEDDDDEYEYYDDDEEDDYEYEDEEEEAK